MLVWLFAFSIRPWWVLVLINLIFFGCNIINNTTLLRSFFYCETARKSIEIIDIITLWTIRTKVRQNDPRRRIFDSFLRCCTISHKYEISLRVEIDIIFISIISIKYWRFSHDANFTSYRNSFIFLEIEKRWVSQKSESNNNRFCSQYYSTLSWVRTIIIWWFSAGKSNSGDVTSLKKELLLFGQLDSTIKKQRLIVE